MTLTEQTDGDGQTQTEKKPDLINMWRKQKPLDYKFLTSQIMVARLVIAVLFAVLLFLGLRQIFKWRDLNALARIEQAEDLKRKEQIFVAVACVFVACYRVLFDCVKTAYAKIMCGRWLAAQNVEPAEYMNGYIKSWKNLNGNIAANKKAIKAFIECAYRAENPSANTAVIGYAICLSACYIAFTACIGVAVTDNIDEFIRASLASEKFRLQYVWLIVSIVVAVVQLAVQVIGTKLYNEKFKAWADKNIIETDWLCSKIPNMFKTM